MKTKTIQLGKIEFVDIAPVYEHEWNAIIKSARRFFPILANHTIVMSRSFTDEMAKDGRQVDISSCDGCEPGNKRLVVHPLSMRTYGYLCELSGYDGRRACRHYIIHKLGHAAIMALTGVKHECGGLDGVDSMLDRYAAEEMTVDVLAMHLSKLAPLPDESGVAL